MSAAKSKRKRRRNRGRFGLLFKVLCALALLGAVFYGATVFFQVEQVEVSGNSRYSQEQVVQATGIKTGDNLFRINKIRISQDVLKKLPYIEKLSICRSLPSTVVIQVQEWAAAACIQPTAIEPVEGETAPETADTSWLISVGGKLLETASASQSAIPVTGISAIAPREGSMLAVPQEQQSKLSNLLLLLQTLDDAGELNRVSNIDVTSDSYLLIRYDGRFDAKIPMGDNIPYHLKVLAKAVETREDYETGTMDLTQKDYAVVFTPD